MKKIFIAILLLGTLVPGRGQSHHFSQSYAAPLLHNPAAAGFTDGPYRVSASFRSQWSGGGSPYLTAALSGDVSPMQGRLPAGSRLGVGATLLNDRSMNGALQANSFLLSAAYHVALDAEGSHHLGAGLQGSFHQKRFDYSKLTFENQYGPGGFEGGLPIGEAIDMPARSNYMDVAAGLLYNYAFEGKAFFAGVGGYNLLQRNTQPGPDPYRLPTRLSFQAGGQVEVGYAGTLYLSANHLQMGGSRVTTLGGAYGLQLGEGEFQEVNLGLWHRLGDAVIPYLGYQVGGLQFGLSYDYTLSQVKSGGNTRNGYELTLVYRAPDNSELKRLVPWY